MRIKPLTMLFVLLLSTGIYFSALTVSGDAGEQWSKQKSAEMCANPDISAVYICLGNNVKAVWKDEAKGSTFYRTDGKTTECPQGTAAQIGAECVQMLMPNYCPIEAKCGEAQPQEFPGATETGGEKPPEIKPQETKPPETKPVVKNESTVPSQNENKGPIVVPFMGESTESNSKATTSEGQAFDALTLGIIGLAIIAIILLYLLFKRTQRPAE